MRKFLISTFFWIASLAFVAPAQAGPFDVPEDSYVTHSRSCD